MGQTIVALSAQMQACFCIVWKKERVQRNFYKREFQYEKDAPVEKPQKHVLRLGLTFCKLGTIQKIDERTFRRRFRTSDALTFLLGGI
jgi:hypothetical protein